MFYILFYFNQIYILFFDLKTRWVVPPFSLSTFKDNIYKSEKVNTKVPGVLENGHL